MKFKTECRLNNLETLKQRNSQQNGKKVTATHTEQHKYSLDFHKSKFIVIGMNILNFGDCVKNMWNPNK